MPKYYSGTTYSQEGHPALFCFANLYGHQDALYHEECNMVMTQCNPFGRRVPEVHTIQNF
jgi:hypothetical protein